MEHLKRAPVPYISECIQSPLFEVFFLLRYSIYPHVTTGSVIVVIKSIH
jgi:hypothetical protein